MLFLLVQISPWWYATPDSSAQYQSIARKLWTEGGPTAFGSKHLFFSLGYPLTIAPAFLISERPFLWIGLVHWLLAMLLWVGIYRWARPLGIGALFTTLFTLWHVHYGSCSGGR